MACLGHTLADQIPKNDLFGGVVMEVQVERVPCRVRLDREVPRSGKFRAACVHAPYNRLGGDDECIIRMERI